MKTNISIEALYEQDVTNKLNKIKARILAGNKLSQKEIITYSNYKIYDFHRSNEQELKQAIEGLFQEHINYLDLTKDEFIASFPGNYVQRVFELIMSDFLAKNYELINRYNTTTVDLFFVCNNKRYLLECVTRNPGQMDKFYDLLINFEHYYSAVKILFNAHTRCAKIYNRSSSEWYYNIKLLWHDLENTEKLGINNIFQAMGIVGEDRILKKLEDWVYYNRYARRYFIDLIPHLSERLDNIRIPTTHCDNKKLDEFSVNCIVNVIIQKLRKPYFANNEPIILAISLSTFVDIVRLDTMSVLIKYLESNLAKKLNEAISKENDKDTLNKNLRNLYAILIDANSYNWFPDIVRKKYKAEFLENFNNCYGVIYNTNIANYIYQCVNERIFNLIVPFYIELSLGIEDKSISENFKENVTLQEMKRNLIDTQLKILANSVHEAALSFSLIEPFYSGKNNFYLSSSDKISIFAHLKSLCGLLPTLLLDKRKNGYLTVSLATVIKDIVSFEKSGRKPVGERHRERFNETRSLVLGNGRDHIKIKEIRDKIISHKELKQDHTTFSLHDVKLHWSEIVSLFELVKQSLENISLYWQECEFDYSDVESIREDFWSRYK